jgi:hypothetical protein
MRLLYSSSHKSCQELCIILLEHLYDLKREAQAIALLDADDVKLPLTER